MKELGIDIETYSSRDLAKCGVYKYVEAPDFTILLFAYSVDNVETIELNQKEKVLSDEWALTLFTCTPGGKTRVVVHCMAAKC